MKELNHPHVMTLIGVCLDAGPGVSIVMPFMANGNLLQYLKRERTTLELCDDTENEQVSSFNINIDKNDIILNRGASGYSSRSWYLCIHL